MNQRDLFRFIRLCFWDAMKEFIGLAYKSFDPNVCIGAVTIAALKAATENEQIKEKFLAEPIEKGLSIIWFVSCLSCEKENDVEVILENDQPGKPIVCPECGGNNIDVILKGVIEVGSA